MKKEYRMLAFVPRWAIAPRHHGQSVAEHSYYVALYASELCDMLDIKWGDRIVVVDAALRHDAREAWESDIPGPAKRSIVDPVKVASYEEKFAEGMGPLYTHSMADMGCPVWATVKATYASSRGFIVRDIIKVADLIDEVFYLAYEQNLGNNMLRGLYQREMSRLDLAAQVLAGEQFAGELLDVIGTEIARIADEGAFIPANDTDIPKDPSFKGTSDHVSDWDRSEQERVAKAITKLNNDMAEEDLGRGDASGGPSRPELDVEEEMGFGVTTGGDGEKR